MKRKLISLCLLPLLAFSHWAMDFDEDWASAKSAIVYESVWLKLDDTGATKKLVNSGTASVTFTNVVSNASARTVAGKLGGAFAYTSSERSVCADAALMQLLAGTSYSFAFWAKRASTTAHAGLFYMIFAPPDTLSVIYYNKDNQFLFWYSFLDDGVIDVSKKFSMPADAWQHFAYTRSSSVFKLYVNGALVTTTTFTGSPVYTPLHMDWGWGGPDFPGNTRTLDDIRVYDFTLSAAEVASLYNGGNGSESTLVRAPDTH